ncbi:fimbrial protein [Raoultella ornithinolytica]|uniref:fimbrial protein n=1 Tax=Raoultella ornithinolytica TaxID=54291 RepID=UPI001A3484F6|nr:fimbrial protein [Raoultella ornithinolytica]ELS5400755.1 fimbrial protein [Raoultella ornithinolytica]ELS5455538.1 fimbrial protein [Raoultella ornithinolytica]ELS5479858.1 fimbrial protein [Raoultella ornithinolytica]MDV1389536.1 fimbrial protein [Raoultella ornithinolytica]ULI43280.1 fimbrial protein [Raoultella ornithinolytica]
MTNPRYRLLTVLIALTLAPASWSSLTVNVTGVVVEGVCEINNGETIHVDFGNNLQPRLIDGENFMKAIEYSLTCEDLTSNDLEMEFEGIATSFSEDYLATDREGLGIKLYMNGESMPLNTWMPFTWPEVPVLQAAPVKSEATEVETGVFSASATLKIQYH